MSWKRVLSEMSAICSRTQIGAVQAGTTLDITPEGLLNAQEGNIYFGKITSTKQVLPIGDEAEGFDLFWTAASSTALPNPPSDTQWALIGDHLWLFDQFSTPAWTDQGQVEIPKGTVLNFKEMGYLSARQKAWDGTGWLNPSSGLPPINAGDAGKVLTSKADGSTFWDVANTFNGGYLRLTGKDVGVDAAALAAWLRTQGFYTTATPPPATSWAAIPGKPAVAAATIAYSDGDGYIKGYPQDKAVIYAAPEEYGGARIKFGAGDIRLDYEWNFSHEGGSSMSVLSGKPALVVYNA